jgi:hypothetical protein
MVKNIGLTEHDISVLRELAEWKVKSSGKPENQEKIQAWINHDNGLPGSRVMVIAETWYTTGDTIRPVNDNDLLCSDPWARKYEYELRLKKFEIDVMRDDHFVLPWMEYNPFISISDFGLPSAKHKTSDDSMSFNYQSPPLTNLDDADFAKIHHRTFTWDRTAEEQEHDKLESVFGKVIKVRRRTGSWQLGMPFTSTCLDFVGLNNFLMLLFDNPEGIHRLMNFIKEDHLSYIRFLEENALLDLNNETDYIGSGCMGCSKNLPVPDFKGVVRTKDLWYYCESQESVGISPDMYGEFVFPYIAAIAEKFGRVYYGCCEPVNPIVKYLETLKNLKRVSVPLWADEEKVADFCRKNKIVFSRKPPPPLFMGEKYDEHAVRANLEKTVSLAEGCRLEFVYRDVYTVNNEPERFVRWVAIAREAGDKHKG